MGATAVSTTERLDQSSGTRTAARRMPRRSVGRRAVVATATIGLGTTVGLLVVGGDVGHPAAIVAPIAMVPAAAVDVDERRLPNVLVGAAAVAVILTAALVAVGEGSLGAGPMAIGAGLMAAPLLVMHLVAPASMGFGDVKAATVLGAGLGTIEPQLSLVALCIASAATALVGLVGRRRDLPFGPGLVGGTWITALVTIVAGTGVVGVS